MWHINLLEASFKTCRYREVADVQAQPAEWSGDWLYGFLCASPWPEITLAICNESEFVTVLVNAKDFPNSISWWLGIWRLSRNQQVLTAAETGTSEEGKKCSAQQSQLRDALFHANLGKDCLDGCWLVLCHLGHKMCKSMPVGCSNLCE